MIFLDAYERRARLVPGLMLVAPLGVMMVMFGLNHNPVVSVILGSLTTFGVPFVLATFVRHKGLGVQDDLWASWGGKPTTQLLKGGRMARRDRWREGVQHVTGHQLPDPSEPRRDDDYDAAVAIVISKTRDPAKFKLVFEENRNYGYERNLYGLHKLGLLISASCLAGSSAAVGVLAGVANRKVRVEWLAGLVALSGLFLIWVFLPSRSRARTTAFKYAEQLLDAAVDLAGQ